MQYNAAAVRPVGGKDARKSALRVAATVAAGVGLVALSVRSTGDRRRESEREPRVGGCLDGDSKSLTFAAVAAASALTAD